MPIDYDYYTQLSDKEIDKLLVHLKNIQHLRQNDLQNIFKNYDSEGLKDYLTHHDNAIPKFILENIYALAKLDTCSNDNKEANFILALCQTQYRSAFLDQNLFDTFFHKFGFQPDMIEFFEKNDRNILTHYIHKGFAFYVSENTIQTLCDKHLIDFTDPKLQESFLTTYPEHFIIYGLKNNLLSLDKITLRNIFFTQLPHYSIENLDYVKNQLKGTLFEPTVVSLKDLMNKIFEGNLSNRYHNDSEDKIFYQHIKDIIKINSVNFNYILSKIDLEENDFHIMLKALNNTYPNNNKNFIALLVHLRDNPKNWSDELLFKEVNQNNFPTISNGGFRQMVIKSLFNFKLERHLDNDKEKKSQMKI